MLLYSQTLLRSDNMQFIQLTPQLGELIKSFRIRNEKTAKDISTIIQKTPSYLSKIESGATKKIETSVFIKMCDAITDSENGIELFIEFAFQSEKTESPRRRSCPEHSGFRRL